MEEAYEFFLHSMPGIGDISIEKLLDRYGNAKDAVEAIEGRASGIKDILTENKISLAIERIKNTNAESEYAKLQKMGIEFITKNSPDYPERLKEITPVPYALYVKGKLPENDIPAVAIIGARNCSEYGTFVADSFGRALASEGVNIISGMARGIDGIGQRGAIEAGGATYGILGCGVDICYPLGNLKLYRMLEEKGGLISIFPPGTAPVKQNFPMRNRIVAGLSDIILVVEAREKSGTSITVDMALKMGKDVYSIPGRLTDRLSDGCNKLIREGAGVALSPEDILKEIELVWERKNGDREKLNYDFTKGEYQFKPQKDKGVLAYIDAMPKSVDEIHAERVKKEPGIPLEQTMSEIMLECMEGRVIQVGTGYFYKVFGSDI